MHFHRNNLFNCYLFGINHEAIFLAKHLQYSVNCLFYLQQSYPSFWPEKSKMEKYGPVFSVHSVSRKHYQNIKQWEYKINKKVRDTKWCAFSVDFSVVRSIWQTSEINLVEFDSMML